ncbi:diaminohydroxyphosphoribosylaminopyrimidine deaminase / 5-amino-6-(5-phosphoribosylamino)uracil reductase [Steroidobacter denitrificans]|uniref:Riboflavin biosynthesis protein RibD n=2 Tax=Steroidobacter denitrificans TaxID=465721 RepID=A0A127FCW7_STEDE|nr:diaminohydroxyphosphoribosylaminopyrimidine deaminase / 5-amino-6-(5-phosphoribosylamino)uracil reductase [Steroidobacter denitrificans]
MMRHAIELAGQGRYSNHPNPRVGCVIVHEGRIVGEGSHLKWGEAHAEVHALQAAGAAARGADCYVTLEPHSYQGRTPPCTEALIRAGVARVFCGALDPNPKVHGEGVRQLRAAGIEVHSGLLEPEVRELNLGFEQRMRSGLPRVIVKVAASLDGRVALANGVSQWITGEQARADVQRLRAQASAVLTGIDTALADDPQLNVRDPAIELRGRQPLRVVLDTGLRLPAAARMLQMAGETLVMTSAANLLPGAAAAARLEALQAAGAQCIGIGLDAQGRLDLREVWRELGRRQCNDVLVEAGPTLTGSLLHQGMVDEWIIYYAPMVLGGDARAMAVLPALQRLEEARRFELQALSRIGTDAKLVLRTSAGSATNV